MKMQLRLVLGMFALCAAALVQAAQADVVDGSGEAFCSAMSALPLPVADQPTAAEARALGKDCRSIELYEGVGKPPDYRKARLCAYIERAASENPGESGMSGDAVLMMIYANARGVPRNIPLARQFACEMWAASAEQDLRQCHLDGMQAGPDPGTIHVCDDITSGFMMGECAWLESRQSDALRNARLDALGRGFPAPVAVAYLTLRKAASGFAQSSASNEQDLSGTARGVFFQERRANIEDQFAENVTGFLQGKFPKAAGDPAADRALNTTYRVLLKSYVEPEFPGTITVEDLRATQRAWIVYRDAWIGFSKALRPDADTTSLLRALTTARTAQLRAIGSDE